MMKHLLAFLLLTATASAADFDVVYVRSKVPEGRMSIMPAAGAEYASEESKLMILRAGGAPEVLYDPGAGKAIIDPRQDSTGKWVYFTQLDGLPEGFQRTPFIPEWVHKRAVQGADIYRVNVATRQMEKLTDQAGDGFANEPRYYRPSGTANLFGVLNLGACPVPGGMVFTSDRETVGVNQLYFRHDDGRVEKTGFLNLANCLNPTALSNGKVLWSTHENQGLRGILSWGLWSSYPDGRQWEPEFSAFFRNALYRLHCEARKSNGERIIVTTAYYGGASSGYGTFFTAPLEPRAFTHELPPPLSADVSFLPKGATWLTPWASSADSAASIELGKVSHPSPARPGQILCSWTPGPVYMFANKFPGSLPENGVYMDSGVYLMPVDAQTTGPEQLVKVIDEPGWNEYFPVPLLTDVELYGREIPKHDFLPVATHPALKPGEPYALLGTSGVYERESAPLVPSWNFLTQGADSGKFENSEIHAIRLLTMEIHPVGILEDLRTLLNHNETLRVLGEIPVRKPGVIDAAGNPDTSFLAKIPADVPFTFQLIDELGQALTTSQTWHHLRSGEVRHDCRGCHAHTKPGIAFEGTAASKPDYPIVDLTAIKPKVVEFHADIKPIFERHDCNGCHDGTDPGAPRFDFNNWFVGGYNVHSYRFAVDHLLSAYQSRTSKLMKHLRGVEGFAQMPKNGEPLTAEELRTIATWIDTGAAIGSLANKDHTKPTVAIVPGKVGAFDFNLASVKVNGVEVGTTNGVYPAPAGTVEVVATDASGHTTKLVRTLSEPEPPPPARTPKAVYLGLDGDNVGPARQGTPDGTLDHHIKLTGLEPTYHRVNVHFGATKWSNEAEIPIVLGRPSIPGSPLGELDLWFAPRNGSEMATEFIVFVLKADGTDDRIVTTLPSNQQAVVDALKAEVERLQEIIQAVRDAVD